MSGNNAKGIAGSIMDAFRKLSLGIEESGSVSEMVKKRIAKVTERDPKKANEEMYSLISSSLLKEEGLFTFRKFQTFLQNILKGADSSGLRGKLPWKPHDPGLDELKTSVKILEAMLPEELDSDDPRIFTREAKQMLAEAAEVDPSRVNELLLSHEVFKTERTWFMRRIMLGRPLPKTINDRDYEALADRPFTQAMAFGQFRYSLELRKAMSKDYREKTPRPKTWAWYRPRTSGTSRWRRQPYNKTETSARYFPPRQRRPPGYLYSKSY